MGAVDTSRPDAAALAFITRWQNTTASELSTAQSFVRELCDLLVVENPHATAEQHYMFERPITFHHGDGSASAGRIDCYRRGSFVLEAKKLKTGPHTKVFDDALLRARAQAESYARALPAEDGRPPFLLVVDVGNVIELYAEFTRSGATYTPFPDPRSHRIPLSDLARPQVRATLRAIWIDPESLNPARASARVTREVSSQLAQLAKSLEAAGHHPDHVAAFLTRCLFSMFAEDVELLPKGSFLGLLEQYRAEPPTLLNMVRVLWADMDRGGFSAALAGPVLRFNGKLFKESGADGYVLLLTPVQINQLIAAAKSNWREVEPAIFGTLLERALEPTERHALGAHYTPRAYVERLVLPTVVEPLRADWANVQAAAVVLATDGKLEEARAEVRKFHHQLCTVRVLDPACGSGNFLYVTLEHLKRLEGEVLNQLEALGETQDKLGWEGETVTLQQLRGIELNERAAAVAELVLWIGYLQWHIRTRGNKAVAEPVIHDYGNIEHRDAVLECDDQELAYDEQGNLLTRWDGRSFKTHPVTGALVPDEAGQLPQWKYIRPRKAIWPQADFIVGNPPFIGKLKMREALGDGYVEALRNVWTDVPDSADFVMYWWANAAAKVANGQALRMGLISTNSLTMVYNRRVVQAAQDAGARLLFAIADHPWVDSANGAAVRIAMTVLGKGQGEGQLLTVTHEQSGEHGEVVVVLRSKTGVIHADLSLGANVAKAVQLTANGGMSHMGVILVGTGFVVKPEDPLLKLEPGRIKSYMNGRDLTQTSRGVFVIDLAGLSQDEVRLTYPRCYQRLYDTVRLERAVSQDPYLRDNWWLFRRTNTQLRSSLCGLKRYIGTTETAKHRTFSFIDGAVLPDQKIRIVSLDDAYFLGVLSGCLHVEWALATGGRLGVGNDPVYNNTRCFETFPFPATDTGLTPALRERIATLAEQIDAHRKRQQAANPGLTLTGMYNVLEALREGRDLTAKEKAIHEQGLVGVLKDLHDELDTAVLAAYSLGDVPQADWLECLVALNAQRAEQERRGIIRWLRPDFQNPQARPAEASATPEPQAVQAEMALDGAVKPPAATATATGAGPQPWPVALPDQVRAVAQMLATQTGALPVAEIETRFKGRGPWKRSLPRILETLEALGRARREGDTWRAG